MPIMFLIFIALILFFIIYPKIKKSERVEKYTKDLLEDVVIDKDVDSKITDVKKGVNDLEDIKKENEKKQKELGLESEKIDKFIGKDIKKDE